MSDSNFKLPDFLNNINLNDVAKNFETLQKYQSYAYSNPMDTASIETAKMRRSLEDASEQIAKKNSERELREKRMLEISEEKLELDKFKVFLLQSVNRDQKEMLEKVDSLIDTVDFGNKVEEANLAIIEQELLDLKQSTDKLNEGFIKLVEKKMTEMGVEAAIKYLLVGMKMLFLNQQ